LFFRVRLQRCTESSHREVGVVIHNIEDESTIYPEDETRG